jgi:hypothetical protein
MLNIYPWTKEALSGVSKDKQKGEETPTKHTVAKKICCAKFKFSKN